MTTKKSNFNPLTLLIVLAVLLLCAVTVWALTKLPLAPKLAIKTSTATAGVSRPALATGTSGVPGPALATATATQPVPSSTCGRSGSIVLLVVAADQAQWSVPHTEDFIRYVKINFSQISVDVVAIPRDLWVQTPALAPFNVFAYRLGEVYYYETNRDVGSQRDTMIRATTLLGQTLYDNFGIVPDHYLTLDGGSIAPMVDTLGGVDINNSANITIEGYLYPAGRVHLNGEQASIYSRWLITDTEWDRLSRQKNVILGIWDKVLEPASLSNLPNLLQQFSNSYVTDLSPELITSLTCMMNKVAQEDIHFYSISQDMVSPGPNNTMLPDVDRIKQFLQGQLAP
jgi:anionic cell wall polymer biosynthesis LytR-Cps2A-Psr (LCP) family protein